MAAAVKYFDRDSGDWRFLVNGAVTTAPDKGAANTWSVRAWVDGGAVNPTGGGILAEWSVTYIGGASPAVTVPVGSGAFVSLVEPDPEIDYTVSRYSLVSSGTGVTFDAGSLLLGPGLWSVSFVGEVANMTLFAAEITVDDLGDFGYVFSVLGTTGAGSWTGRVIAEASLALVAVHGEATDQEVGQYYLSVVKLAD